MSEVRVAGGGTVLRGEEAGTGDPVLLLHGLTATRRYVVHGSRALERGGRRVIAYDARGHGESDPAPSPDAYRYPDLAADALAVLDAAGVERAALVGQSMGAATATAVALARPDRVRALVLVTPAHLGRPSEDLARWDRLADGTRPRRARGLPRRPGAALRRRAVARDRRHRDPPAPEPPSPPLGRGRRAARRAALGRLRRAGRARGARRADAGGGEPRRGRPGPPARRRRGLRGADPRAPSSWSRQPGETPLAWRGGTLSSVILDFLGRRERA